MSGRGARWPAGGVAVALALAGGLVVAAGCASKAPKHADPVPDPVMEKMDPKTAEQRSTQIHTELIRQMIDKGEYYAALAHIQQERIKNDSDQSLMLLEAECRRELGQIAPADRLYRALLDSPFAGEAYHGLGLLYVQSDLPFALASLQRAAARLPTNAAVRNDLGRALMESGRYTEAMPELSTAAELAPDEVKSRNNLIVLMMLMGNEAAVLRLAQESGTGPVELQSLRDQAQRIHARQASPPVSKAS